MYCDVEVDNQHNHLGNCTDCTEFFLGRQVGKSSTPVDESRKYYWNIGNYILWVGGIDDHFDTLEGAEMAMKMWKDRGYKDVYVESKEEMWAGQAERRHRAMKEVMERIHRDYNFEEKEQWKNFLNK